MNKNRGNGFAVVLIAIGAILLLGALGPLIHGLFRLVFPILLVLIGYYAVNRGHKLIGFAVMFVGILSLINKLAWLIGPLLGIALLVWGISVLRGSRPRRY
ncbi:hypothetical protein F4V43_00650 [Paenibacillus spiritus]|uniref:LiaF transmembrane domain-containing protein n=1 Tax=Paenibacillus spiritus TaxID=2496557 RepID=A0A5J5GK28_9BACL|nr:MULTISPECIES: hypothetical protein [Paenibacillus]KAA9008671.1 hypothetical protein F4V43_00650 [Paenibacillus spiritus]